MCVRGLRLRLCLRGGRTVTSPDFSVPPRDLLERQAARLSQVRARLLRRCQIATRRRILDLGCGYGAATPELVRRGGGEVIALDREHGALAAGPEAFRSSIRICGDAVRLPFADACLDLVFSQFALLWMDLAEATREVGRVLRPGGVLAAIEPDYGGMIEFPESIRTQALWIAALRRAGADPLVGRKLPATLAARGFVVRTELVPEIDPSEPTGAELLAGLPLLDDERAELRRIADAVNELRAPWARIVHLPVLLLTATKRE